MQGKHAERLSFLADARGIDEINRETAELIAFLGLQGIEQVRADSLSYGGQRLVDMGMALATKPKILLLDEPLAGPRRRRARADRAASSAPSPSRSRC